MFSAYMLDPTYGWVATHRLPLESAIYHCKQYRHQHQDCPVALVPDNVDPAPYLMLAECCSNSLKFVLLRNSRKILGL